MKLLVKETAIPGHCGAVSLEVPYYMKFWRHVNLAILKNPYLATL